MNEPPKDAQGVTTWGRTDDSYWDTVFVQVAVLIVAVVVFVCGFAVGRALR